jgi:hypothetical protein
MDRGAAKTAKAAVMDRRSILQAGVTLGAGMLLPAASRAIPPAAALIFDVIDRSVWVGKGDVKAYLVLDPGSFLSLEHLANRPRRSSLTALLSPANAFLLAEYLRFDPDVVIEEHSCPVAQALANAQGRTVTAIWGRPPRTLVKIG